LAATTSVTTIDAHVFVPGVQLPDWQVSELVHVLPSLHVVPSASTGFEQVPVLGLQLPVPWH